MRTGRSISGGAALIAPRLPVEARKVADRKFDSPEAFRRFLQQGTGALQLGPGQSFELFVPERASRTLKLEFLSNRSPFRLSRDDRRPGPAGAVGTWLTVSSRPDAKPGVTEGAYLATGSTVPKQTFSLKVGL